ncbi:MAG TPA: hypothetical protein VMV26_13110 [Alphaproteobacteria bacterium]|jgi:hypothetical protein|nr:hypothetical protein [Alphaproteobacteria bacterium]
MTIIYVAVSKETQRWASDVGLTKHVYKLGFAEGADKKAAEAAIAALNASNHAGAADWKLIKFQPVESVDEDAAYQRLAKRARMADPGYYPHLKGARGVFKIKPADVEAQMLVRRAMNDPDAKPAKSKALDVAEFLIRNALA